MIYSCSRTSFDPVKASAAELCTSGRPSHLEQGQHGRGQVLHQHVRRVDLAAYHLELLVRVQEAGLDAAVEELQARAGAPGRVES